MPIRAFVCRGAAFLAVSGGEGREVESRGDFRLLGGWLIDGTGSPVRGPVRLRVARGLITAVEDAEPNPLPAAGEIDLRYATLLPALVDCHLHLCLSGSADPAVRKAHPAAPYEEAQAIMAGHVRSLLGCGVAAARDGGDPAGHVLHFRERNPALRLALRSPGPAWHAQGRYGGLIGRPPEAGRDLAAAIARRGKIGDHIKIVNSGLNSLREFGRETAPQFDPGELARAVAAARRLGLRTMVHANGRPAVRGAVEAGCDSIEHGFFMGADNLGRMAERGTVWVPTAGTMQAYAESPACQALERDIARRNLEHQLGQMAEAARRGTELALGTDAGSPGVHHGAGVIREFQLFLEAGFPLPRVVKAAGWTGARLLGLERELGRIEPGLPATLVAVRGGPEALPASLARPEAMFIRGAALTADAGASMLQEGF